MKYQQAKAIVCKRYPLANLVAVRRVKPKAGPNGGDSIQREYYIADGHEVDGPGPSLTGDLVSKTVAQAWIAVATMIVPSVATFTPEAKAWPMRNAWTKKRDKRLARRGLRAKATTGKQLAK